jgi:ABC-type polysaccharide/polyol phosphate transport system ATPase subunit
MKKTYAIEAFNISKRYSLLPEKPLLLKSILGLQKKPEFWALKDVSFSVEQGESFGIIGPNGSGKSTLLKILTGITTATSGSVKINGRIASLIELGAGFHPDLTGQENVYLYAALLGFTKKELDLKYKDIINFADLGKFVQQPLRTYSVGMSMRLGFSVAIHLDPDILLIDEVLAVGDGPYQKKCVAKIQEMKKEGKTIIFVSHNLDITSNLCTRSLFLKNGLVQCIGITSDVIEEYKKQVI